MMQEFFYMDGKWMYIWGSYAITAAFMIFSFIFAKLRKNKLLKEIEDNLEE